MGNRFSALATHSSDKKYHLGKGWRFAHDNGSQESFPQNHAQQAVFTGESAGIAGTRSVHGGTAGRGLRGGLKLYRQREPELFRPDNGIYY